MRSRRLLGQRPKTTFLPNGYCLWHERCAGRGAEREYDAARTEVSPAAATRQLRASDRDCTTLSRRASSTQVTLVSAPAGCGKTALVAAWLTDLPEERWAWLSLDPRDNDLVRFWSYLIEALRSLTEGVGERALQELVRSGGQGPAEQWLGLLLNELAAVDQPTSYLVVDDLHVITDPEIRASITLFAASMPSWLRLIIVTRADPPLPWPRLRAEGRLAEIRQSDLRFDSRRQRRCSGRRGSTTSPTISCSG